MKFDFVLTPEDLARAADGNLNVALPGIALAGILVGSCACLCTSPYPPLAAVVVVSIAIASAVTARHVHRSARRDLNFGPFAAESPRRSVELAPEFVSQSTPHGTNRVPWAVVHRIQVHPTHLEIWTGPKAGFFVPARAVPDRVALVRMLRTLAPGKVEILGCPQCGYDASGSAASRCPECGHDFVDAA